MIASLGMYDFGPAQAANDRLWALIRDALRADGHNAPETLTRGEGAYWPAWESPALVLSQTCGYPYRARLHGHVTLVGTPDYGLPGCPPGHYRSVFVARRDDPRATLQDFAGAPMAFNEDLSQSGWAAPAHHLLSLGLTPAPALRSGGHRLSVQAVAEGRADLAGVDALTWAMLQGHEPAADRLKFVAETALTPALPYRSRRRRRPGDPGGAATGYRRAGAGGQAHAPPARAGVDSRRGLSGGSHAAASPALRHGELIKSPAEGREGGRIAVAMGRKLRPIGGKNTNRAGA